MLTMLTVRRSLPFRCQWQQSVAPLHRIALESFLNPAHYRVRAVHTLNARATDYPLCIPAPGVIESLTRQQFGNEHQTKNINRGCSPSLRLHRLYPAI